MEEGMHMDEIHPYAVATFIESYNYQFIRYMASGKAYLMTFKAGPP